MGPVCYISAIMLKYFAMSCVLAILASGHPEKNYGKEQASSHKIPSQPVTMVDNSTHQAEANTPAQKPPESHAGIEWANWALVLVGALTFVAVWKQTRESTEATKAMRDSVRIQSAGMKQWIDVQVTRSEGELVYRIGGTDVMADTIKIWLSAANPTPYPLTIREIFVNIRDPRPDGREWGTYRKVEAIILSPRNGREPVIGQQNIFDHHFFVIIDLDQVLIQEYRQHKLFVSVSGYISFAPVVGPIENQAFGYSVSCGHDNAHPVPLGSELENTNKKHH